MRSIISSAVSRASLIAVLAFVAILRIPTWGLTLASPEEQAETKSSNSVATLAGGCFWCTEAVFEQVNGVNDVVSGYIGGTVPNPTYRQVCSKLTGHAEAVEIYYDPTVTNFEELLKVFFKTHDPTTLDRQGGDKGSQYRSAIFYHDAQQKEIAEKYIKKLGDSGDYDDPIVTTLEEATTFYRAERIHQDYFRLNPKAGYCRVVVRPKIAKFNLEFGDITKKPKKIVVNSATTSQDSKPSAALQPPDEISKTESELVEEGKALVRTARQEYKDGEHEKSFKSYQAAISILEGRLRELATSEFRRVFKKTAEQGIAETLGKD